MGTWNEGGRTAQRAGCRGSDAPWGPRMSDLAAGVAVEHMASGM